MTQYFITMKVVDNVGRRFTVALKTNFFTYNMVPGFQYVTTLF